MTCFVLATYAGSAALSVGIVLPAAEPSLKVSTKLSLVKVVGFSSSPANRTVSVSFPPPLPKPGDDTPATVGPFDCTRTRSVARVPSSLPVAPDTEMAWVPSPGNLTGSKSIVFAPAAGAFTWRGRAPSPMKSSIDCVPGGTLAVTFVRVSAFVRYTGRSVRGSGRSSFFAGGTGSSTNVGLSGRTPASGLYATSRL